MPAGGAVATGMTGEDVIDLGVCMKLLKRSIVFLPLLIMLIIFIIKVTLTHHKADGGGGGGGGGGEGGSGDGHRKGGRNEIPRLWKSAYYSTQHVHQKLNTLILSVLAFLQDNNCAKCIQVCVSYKEKKMQLVFWRTCCRCFLQKISFRFFEYLPAYIPLISNTVILNLFRSLPPILRCW